MQLYHQIIHYDFGRTNYEMSVSEKNKQSIRKSSKIKHNAI